MMESTDTSRPNCPPPDENVASTVYKSDEDTNASVENHRTVSQPPPLLLAVTSSQQPQVGSCHVASPVATAAIWAVLPGRSGADFAVPSDSSRYPSTAEQCRTDNFLCGDETSQRLPYRDILYPGSYADVGDPPAWSTGGPYYPRIGGPLTADLPPAPHPQSLIMSSCEPAAYQVGEDWYPNYDYSLPAADAATYGDRPRHDAPQPVQRPQPAAAVPSSGAGTTKRKRRRIITADQRRAANVRERRRMSHLNDAFDGLRKRVPTFAYEKKLSRIETLRLAVTYIGFMADLLGTMDGGGVRYELSGCSDGAGYSADGAGGQYPVSLHCDDYHGRSSTTFELSDIDADYDDDDDAATGSCSPGLSCLEDAQEPLELTNYRDNLVDSRVCGVTVSDQQPCV